jgi:putative solute:sodium symporter small subunit
MRKIDKSVADAYFKKRTRNILIFLLIGFVVSFGVVFFVDSARELTFNGFPLHYYMGAQGSIVIFIALLFINAIVSDKIDRDFGIDESQNKAISSGKVLDH